MLLEDLNFVLWNEADKNYKIVTVLFTDPFLNNFH